MEPAGPPSLPLPGSGPAFIEWLRGLGGLRTFWTKPVEASEAVSLDPLVVSVAWRVRRGCRRALFVVSDGPVEELAEPAGAAGASGGVCLFAVTRLELDEHLYDRWSVVYVYDRDSRLLAPNTAVNVEVDDSASAHVLAGVEHVQRRSWGFYMPPRPGSHVLLARLQGEPVGSAYYHARSGNVDYGVHVARGYWRMRIGTRLLHEVARLAWSTGREWFTIVRVIRGRRPTASDRRAMGFYEANNPKAKFYVYKLRARQTLA